jgi:hydrogenase maturation protease
MHDIVVIGYGNELRGDDGAGPFVARLMARRYPHLRAVAVHQLTPELAECLAAARLAVFVDARNDTVHEEVDVNSLTPRTAETATHHSDPQSLLGLAQSLYGHAPDAWLVTIPGRDFSIGERLSPAAHAATLAACQSIEELISTVLIRD